MPNTPQTAAAPPATTSRKRTPRRLSPLSARVRDAIDLIAAQGLTQTAAAQRVGIGQAHLSRQLARPDAQALILARKKELAESLDGLTEHARRRAMVCAYELMDPGQPVEIRARMVELFVKAKLIVAPVNVNISAALAPDPGGYTYRRPRDITPPTDYKSGSLDADD